MPSFRSLLPAVLCLYAGPLLAAPRVAVDIAPIHSIVARVMAGAGTPDLVLPPGASPHGYALRPSNAGLIDSADLVIWIGPDLTPWMGAPVEALAGKAAVLTLEDLPGVTLLPVRAGGPFEPDADEAPPPGAASRPDGHIWLDPENAVAIARGVSAELARLDPQNAARYDENATAFATEMASLEAAIDARLAPVRGKRFIVFHDAYQYFEHRFDMPAAGSIELAEGEAPSAARVAEIRDRVRREGIVCAFTEPQFEPKLLATVIEGTDVRTGVLDPDVGAGLQPGPELYPALILTLTKNLAACLGS